MAFSHPIEVRFRDLDALGHVNNAVLVTYLEIARTAWWRQHLAGRPFQEDGYLVARVEMDYRKPVKLEDPVVVEVRVPQVGASSFSLDYKIRRATDGVVLAEGQTVQVFMDFRSDRPRPAKPETVAWLRTQA